MRAAVLPASLWQSAILRIPLLLASPSACSVSFILLILCNVLNLVSLSPILDVFYLLQLRKNALSEVVGCAEGDALSWTTHSWILIAHCLHELERTIHFL